MGTSDRVMRKRVLLRLVVGFCSFLPLIWMAASAKASLVTAHTAGTISRTETIRVQFDRTMASRSELNRPLPDAPFRFEPEIRGTAQWIDPRTLVFKPEEWLPSDRDYKVILNLAALMEAPSQPTYAFAFKTPPQAFDMHFDGLRPDPAGGKNRWTASGRVSTADSARDEKVREFLVAEQDGEKLDIRWTHSPDHLEHRFRVNGVQKFKRSTNLVLSWDGTPIGVDIQGRHALEVPADGPLSVLAVLPVHEPEKYLELVFSDSLDPEQNLNGLIRVEKTPSERLRFAIDGNRVRVFHQVEWSGDQQIKVETGIRSARGDRLGEAGTFTAAFGELKPAVRFVGERAVVPTSRGLTLPIETANLRAVVVSAVHIPDRNITQFLQVNTLADGRQLNRVGRPVFRRVIPLHYRAEQKNRWVRHGLDMAPLVERFPGGLFRIEMSFLPEHMVYPCENLNMDPDQPIVETDLPLEDWNEEKVSSFWDSFGGEEGYNYYDFYQQRKNPCHPGYFHKYGDHSISTARNVLVSDIGLIAKKGDTDEIIVAAVNIKTARPLAGVKLTLYDYQQQELAAGSTDKDGMAVLRTDRKPFLLTGRYGNSPGVQHSFLKLDEGSALAVSHFDVAGKTIQKGIKGFLYGERGVWRPGDPIHLTFILQDSEERLPADHPVILEFRDPKGRLADRIVKTESVNGFYTFQTRTAPEAPTGNWLAKVRVGGADFQKMIRVETVMPNRLKIGLELGGKADTLYGGGRDSGAIDGVLSATWLHGAVAKNLEADIKLTFTQRTTRFAGYEAYTFDDPVRSFATEPQTLFEGRLNPQGKTTFKENFTLKDEAPGMLTAHFETRVFEPGGAFSIDHHSLPFHPYSRYVGLMTPKGDKARGMLLTDTDHTVHLAMVDDHGRPVPEGEVEIRLYKIKWRWWWEKGKEDFANFSSATHYRELESDTVKIQNGVGKWQFQIKYPDWGRYMIRVGDANGNHYAGKIIYVDWPGWAGRGQKEIPGAATVLSFSADKSTYRVGEPVTLTVPTGPGGRGLVSIENGTRVLHTEWIEGDGEQIRYTFKAEAAMVPNVYVHITFVQPHLQTQNDRPIRMYGMVPIQIENPDTRLLPVIEAAEEWPPEETARVSVRETDGQPITYTLAVVDEGLLSLTRFKTPNPWDHFFQREALGVKTWDLFDQVAGAYGGVLEQLLALGGDAEAGAEGRKKANRFPPMVRFFGPFELPANGRNTHEVDIPRYLGQVRVMVVAGQDGAYGAAERSVFVRKPLMLLGTLPRVISTEEKVRLPVSVFALSESVQSVAVSVKTEGPLTLAGPAEQRVTFTEPGDRLATFELAAGEQPGVARIDMTAESGDLTARQTLEIDVRIPSAPESKAFGDVLTAGQTWGQEIPFPGVIGTNRVSLEVSRIPPLSLGERLSYLVSYPHGCVEQITSSAFPQIYLDRLMTLPEDRRFEVQEHVNAAIHKLKGFQQADGSFAYWPGAGGYHYWATSYAGHFLLEAKNHGYLVPAGMLDRWTRYQRRSAGDWEEDQPRAGLIQAYRLYTLSLAGAPSLGAMNRLRERSDLSVPARWRLAAAYELAGQPEAAARLVDTAPVEVAPYRELSNTFGSEVRDKAMILETLLLMKRHKDAFSLIRSISDALSSGRWLSTQTTAFCLIAMARAADGAEDRTASRELVFTYNWNDGSEQRVVSDRPLVHIPLEAGQTASGRIVVENRGEGMLYPRLIVSGIPRPGSETRASKGMRLKVKYLNADGESLNVIALEQGTDLKAEITVANTGTAEDYREVALSLLVPSGWEIHNPRLSPSDGTPEDAFTYRDIRDDRVHTYFDLKWRQSKTFTVHLTAAYEGAFYLPAVAAEAMYDAGIHARIPGRWVKVVRSGSQE